MILAQIEPAPVFAVVPRSHLRCAAWTWLDASDERMLRE